MIKEVIYQDLLKTLKDHPKRLQHVIGVKDTAVKFGIKFNLDLDKLEIASYLHDMTKYYSIEKNMMVIKEKYSDYEKIFEEFNENILHAFSAKVLAKNKYLITDTDILDAIENHTIGRPDMNIYEKVIFISDYIEPLITYESCVKVRAIAKESLDLAVFTAVDDSIKFYEKLNSKIPQTAYAARDFYKKLMEVKK